MNCYNCGHEIKLEVTEKIFRQDICPHCLSSLHCCLNCRFYDRLAYHQCHEPLANAVTEKDIANFCSYFEPGSPDASERKARTENAKKKLEDLFKKKPDDE